MTRSRSENQSRARLGWQRRGDVDGVIVIWQTFVISSTSAVPGLVEKGAKTEDLKHGADQSGLLEDLRLEGNFNRDSFRMRQETNLPWQCRSMQFPPS